MKIVVLGGGLSTERQVSLVTATNVCKALRKLGHQAVFVDTFFGLEDFPGKPEEVFDSENGLCREVSVATVAPDIEAVKESRKYKSSSKLGKGVLEVCALADCVFLGLHGEDGEDGKIQAALELLGIPYTGSDHLSSAMALDKTVTKIMMEAAGIPTPAWKQFVLSSEKQQQIAESCKVPCVVKVTNGGSSIGVYICNTKQELKDALTQAESFHMNILVEEKIDGRELTIPILGEKALNAIEIIPPEGKTTFDYVAKYQSGEEGAREICPADISAEQQALLGKLALRLHKALGLSVYSRTDFILDRDGKPWCLEVNTLPGMTPNSLIPRAAKLEGLTYEQLCEKIVELSLNKA